MDEVVLSIEDISQQYNKNIILYKGAYCFVTKIISSDKIVILEMLTQEERIVPFNLHDFKPPMSRLGMINELGSVMYMARLPVRKMGIGINTGNIRINPLPIKYPYGERHTHDTLCSLNKESIANTLLGIFPSLSEICKRLRKEKQGAYAFDRQFAISANGAVFYKNQGVGEIPLSSTSLSQIQFATEYQYLSTLLDNNHEKTVRVPCL